MNNITMKMSNSNVFDNLNLLIERCDTGRAYIRMKNVDKNRLKR